jgi:hypothetical protein
LYAGSRITRETQQRGVERAIDTAQEKKQRGRDIVVENVFVELGKMDMEVDGALELDKD